MIIYDFHNKFIYYFIIFIKYIYTRNHFETSQELKLSDFNS
jgi:hypothetical protein